MIKGLRHIPQAFWFLAPPGGSFDIPLAGDQPQSGGSVRQIFKIDRSQMVAGFGIGR
jgi:hypothetical protein